MRQIRILTNDEHAIFQRLVIQGVRAVAEPRGCAVVVDTHTGCSDPAMVSTPDPADGILVVANAVSPENLRQFYKRHMAVTLVSHIAPDLPVPSVMFNNSQGIGLLVRHLVQDCGRRQLVFVRGLLDQVDGMEREASFRMELMRHEMNPENAVYLRGDFSPDIAVESLADLLRRRIHFDAVLAADYVMAGAVVKNLREQGIQVPEQVAVVGFGDAPEAKMHEITTVAADVEGLGWRAALQLLSQMDGARIRGITTLAVQLVVRRSSMLSA